MRPLPARVAFEFQSDRLALDRAARFCRPIYSDSFSRRLFFPTIGFDFYAGPSPRGLALHFFDRLILERVV